MPVRLGETLLALIRPVLAFDGDVDVDVNADVVRLGRDDLLVNAGHSFGKSFRRFDDNLERQPTPMLLLLASLDHQPRSNSHQTAKSGPKSLAAETKQHLSPLCPLTCSRPRSCETIRRLFERSSTDRADRRARDRSSCVPRALASIACLLLTEDDIDLIACVQGTLLRSFAQIY